MRGKRALALLLLSGILAACGQTGGGSVPGTWTGPADTAGSFDTETALGDVRLSAARTIEGGAVVVHYELVNVGAEAVLVHDRVPPSLGTAVLPEELDPERVWVYMSDKGVRLSKQGFDAAEGVRFIAEPVMGTRLLAPAQRLTGRARAALPARLDVPGPEFDAPRSPVDGAATEFEFCVQVTGGSDGRQSGVDQGVLEVPAAAPREGELVCSQPLGLSPP